MNTALGILAAPAVAVLRGDLVELVILSLLAVPVITVLALRYVKGA